MSKAILIIGALPKPDKDSSYGGTTILLQDFVSFLTKDNSGLDFYLIDTKKFNNDILNYFFVLIKVIMHIPFVSGIFLHSAMNGTKYLSPLLFSITRLTNKKYYFRKFGGGLMENLKNRCFRYVFKKTTLKADRLFVETREIENGLKKINPRANVYWWPNTRSKINFDIENKKEYQRKFVFVSQIKLEKGVNIIIQAFEELGEEYFIDFFGPMMDDRVNFNDLAPNINYRGTLKPNNVRKAMNDYNFLLLPSFYEGEGYPGIILESFSAGLPVLSTYWKAIPEIVNDNCGILIQPKSVNELVKAIKQIDTLKYNRLREGALNEFRKYDSEMVYPKIIEQILD